VGNSTKVSKVISRVQHVLDYAQTQKDRDVLHEAITELEKGEQYRICLLGLNRFLNSQTESKIFKGDIQHQNIQDTLKEL